MENIEKPKINVNDSENGRRSPVLEEIDLFDVLFALAKNWRMIFFVPTVVGAITAVVTLFLPNVYTAKSMILPKDDDSSGMMSAMMSQMGGLAGLAGGLAAGTSKGDLYVTMLKSESIKDPLIDKYLLLQKFKSKFRIQAYGVLNSLSTFSTDKNGVVTISVENEDPNLAAALANSYVEELGKQTARISMNGAGKNRMFLEQKLSKAKADLAVTEEALKSFQLENKAVSVPDQAKATFDGVAELHAQLLSQEVQLSTLRQHLTDESQEIKAVKGIITNLRRQIARFEGSSSNGSIPGVGAMPKLGQEYVRLMREFKIHETLVELLTKQYELNRLNESKDIAPFVILQEAKVPELKSKPKRSLIVSLATLSTGFLMLLITFAREYAARMDDVNRQRWQELRRLLPIPFFFDRGGQPRR